MTFVHRRQMGEIYPRLTEVEQVLSRTQQREVDSALHRVSTVQTRHVALDTKSIECPFGLRPSTIRVDALGKLTNA
jgi:hypothetical protein